MKISVKVIIILFCFLPLVHGNEEFKYLDDDQISLILNYKKKIRLYPYKYSKSFTGITSKSNILPTNTRMIIKLFWNKKKLTGSIYVPRFRKTYFFYGLMDAAKNIYFANQKYKPGIGYYFHGKIQGSKLNGYFSKGSGKKGFYFYV